MLWGAPRTLEGIGLRLVGKITVLTNSWAISWQILALPVFASRRHHGVTHGPMGAQHRLRRQQDQGDTAAEPDPVEPSRQGLPLDGRHRERFGLARGE